MKVQAFPSPFKRTLLTIGAASTTVISAAVVGQTVKLYRLLLTCDAADTIDIQDTGGTSLCGGPLAFGALGSMVLDYTGIPWFTTGTGLGLQFVTSTAANIRGVVDFLNT